MLVLPKLSVEERDVWPEESRHVVLPKESVEQRVVAAAEPAASARVSAETRASSFMGTVLDGSGIAPGFSEYRKTTSEML